MDQLFAGFAAPNPDRLKKIRLVISDLDGTLLTDEKRMPPHFENVVRRLAERGILFSTASGRNWDSQKIFFPDCSQHMAFICDNGAFLMYQGLPLSISKLDETFWRLVVEQCADFGEDCSVIACGIKGAYSIRNPRLQAIVDQFYSDLCYVDTFDQVEDQIFKVSICYAHGTAGEFHATFNRLFSERANIVCTHPLFMDVMNPSIHKAAGIQLLQQHLGITAEETMVFGDYDNDIEMLQGAGLAFIMENAPPEMRAYADFLAPSNNAYGVMAAIETYLLSPQAACRSCV